MRRISYVFIFQLITVGCVFNAGWAADRLSVFVSILPQQYFVQQIGGEQVAVQVMVSPGASPATYEPKPAQMTALSKAAVYFAVGVPFENAWLAKIAAANRNMAVVHTEQGIARMAMASHDHSGDDHGDAHQHGHGDSHAVGEEKGHEHKGLDPHIWLAPSLVKKQAATILKALQAADPANRDHYAANYRTFLAAIEKLDGRLKTIFADRQGARFMVFHPSWGYFARDYGLEQIAIEIEGKDPKPAVLQRLIVQARQTGVKVVFVQPQFSTKSAKVVAAAIGGRVAFADPLAEEWAANLQHVAAQFEAALK